MGEVVFWTLIRIVIILPIVWLLKDRVDYNFWWTASLISIYLLIIHPALVKIKSFNEKKYTFRSKLPHARRMGKTRSNLAWLAT